MVAHPSYCALSLKKQFKPRSTHLGLLGWLCLISFLSSFFRLLDEQKQDVEEPHHGTIEGKLRHTDDEEANFRNDEPTDREGQPEIHSNLPILLEKETLQHLNPNINRETEPCYLWTLNIWKKQSHGNLQILSWDTGLILNTICHTRGSAGSFHIMSTTNERNNCF